MSLTRSALAVTALAVLPLGTTVALAAPASAVAATPQMVCGKGYETVNSAPVGSLGAVYLTYNSSNGMNCVATIRNKPGAAVAMSAWIYVSDTGKGANDFGQYKRYAGPAEVDGRAHCVDWGGNIDKVYVQVTGSNCSALREHRVTFTR